MRLLFKQPRLGFKAGQVGEVKIIGVAKTLISFGVAVEHVEVEENVLVPKKSGGKSRTSGKRKRSKGSSEHSSE